MLILESLQNYFIHPHFKEEEEVYKKARLIAIATICILAAIVLSKLFTIIASVQSDFNHPLAFGSCVLVLLSLKFSNSIFLCGNLLIVANFLMPSSLCLLTGGIFSADLLYLIMVPFLGFLLLGRKAGIVWALLVLAFIYYIGYISNLDIPFYRNQTLRFPVRYYVFLLALLMIIVWIIIYFYELNEEKTINTLKQQRKELELVKKELEEMNKSLEGKVESRTSDLRKVNQELQQYAYITAHNLREPVANMVGLMALYDKEQPDQAFNKTIIEKVEKSSADMDKMVKDLQQIISVKKEEQSQKKNIQFHTVLDRTIHLLENKVTECHAIITSDFTDAPSIEALPAFIDNIFLNLLSNSIKYRSPDRTPKVFISSKKIGPRIQICFQDNGLGIDTHKNKDKLFQLYSRFHPKIEQGTGLGLYLVRIQVEAMGGHISLESEVGKGTRFVIEI